MGMGKYLFRLSDMIPNAWFYKLKDMSSRRKHRTSQNLKKKPTLPRKSSTSQPRNSYYFPTGYRRDKLNSSPADRKVSDALVNDTPRASYKRRSKRKTIYKPSPNKVATSTSAGCSCHAATLDSAWTTPTTSDSPDYSVSPDPLESSPEFGFHESLFLSESEEDDGFLVPDLEFDHQAASLCSSSNCKVTRSNNSDIIIDMNDKSFEKKMKKFNGFDGLSKLELPPIQTKPHKLRDEKTEVNTLKRYSSKMEEMKGHQSDTVKVVKQERNKAHRLQKIASPVTRSPNGARQGIKLRSNSPRIASRKVQAFARKSESSDKSKALSESLAVVKASIDPQRDFRDSMMEMIVENDIQASKDLEELLACYLSLNSQEYHEPIIKAFEQIWLDITHLRM